MKSLNVAMIDLDQLTGGGSRFPNLAQMKISAWLKSEGHRTELIYKEPAMLDLLQYDAIIMSKVFDSTPIPTALIQLMGGCCDPMFLKEYNVDIPTAINGFDGKQIIAVGGTGFFTHGGRDLAPVIEHMMPDYHLYDKMVGEFKDTRAKTKSWFKGFENYSIGFMTRGCFRKCDFCVNNRFDRVKAHSPLAEFLDTGRPKIALWDDNILGYAGWEQIIDELKATGKPFVFRQGLDIRLMSEKKAKKLSECKYDGPFTFAFDHIEDKELIVKKLRLWKKYNKGEPTVYVLCGFDPSNDPNVSELDDVVNTLERVRILSMLGCFPYIMRHKAYEGSKFRDLYIALARWVNQPSMFRNKSILEWTISDSIGKKSMPKSRRTVLQFAEQYPEIAEKYFNMRYVELSKIGYQD